MSLYKGEIPTPSSAEVKERV